MNNRVRVALLLLFVLGFVLFLGGWVYDVLLAELPDRDQAPQMQERWDFHKTVASYIRFGALGAWGLLIAMVAFVSLSEDD